MAIPWQQHAWLKEPVKPEDRMISPVITQQAQLSGPAGPKQLVCPLLNHCIASQTVSKRNSSILRPHELCRGQGLTLTNAHDNSEEGAPQQPPPKHGDVPTSNRIEESYFVQCKNTRHCGLSLRLQPVQPDLAQPLQEAASPEMLYSEMHFSPSRTENGTDHMFT